ncbi:MAG: sulfatase-like hydrolase/transferase [Planctomycetes bacterium]|nr:sulfatase-like hydrolase/transferase [Planctomycetota bacterium]
MERPIETLSIVAAILGLCSAGSPAAERPNIIFILADDLGWGDLGCYGNTNIKTPNLDRLAKRGTLFTQCYMNGSVCSPSRCALFTGQYQARHRIHGHYATREENEARGMSNWLDPEVPNVARLLKQAGYATAHIGKWHLGKESGGPAVEKYGFEFVGTSEHGEPGGPPDDPHFRARSTALFVNEGLRFIEQNKDKPFYLQIWTLVPHAPLMPTDEQMKPYKRFSPGGQDGFPHRSAAEIYYASVTDLDTQIGRLFVGLEKLDLTAKTLIFFSSDNGPEDIHIYNAGHSGIGSAGPFRGRKRSLYEGGVRLPGIVCWPGHVPAGRVDNESVIAGVDWLPTVCRLADATIPGAHALDGEDVGDVLLGRSRARAKPLMWEWRFDIYGEPFHRSPMLAIRDGRWKLLMNPDRSRVELYDIPRDPTELSNEAEREPEVVERLASRVLAWQKELPPGPLDASAGSRDYPWPSESPQPRGGAGTKGRP